MNLTGLTQNGVLILTPDSERIDAAGAIYLKDQFRDLTTDTDCRVVMDLSNVTFMDSSGLGAMVSALKLLQGRKLELSGLTPVVAKVLKLTRMDQVFVVHPDLNAALAYDGANAA